jgi:hypothetical protein
MNAMKLQALADCIKSIQREQHSVEAYGKKSQRLSAENASFTRRADCDEDLSACARQLVRFKHEAHCLCVELGLADLRDDSHYTPARAGLGLSREILIERRRPELA